VHDGYLDRNCPQDVRLVWLSASCTTSSAFTRRAVIHPHPRRELEHVYPGGDYRKGTLAANPSGVPRAFSPIPAMMLRSRVTVPGRRQDANV